MSRVKKHRRAADTYRQSGMLDKARQHEERADQLEFGSIKSRFKALVSTHGKCSKCLAESDRNRERYTKLYDAHKTLQQRLYEEQSSRRTDRENSQKTCDKRVKDAQSSENLKRLEAEALEEKNRRLSELQNARSNAGSSTECTECQEKLKQKIEEEVKHKHWWQEHKQDQDFRIKRLEKQIREKNEELDDARKSSHGSADLKGKVEIKKSSGESTDARRESSRDSINSRRDTAEMKLPMESDSTHRESSRSSIGSSKSAASTHRELSRSSIGSKKDDDKPAPPSPPPPPPPPPRPPDAGVPPRLSSAPLSSSGQSKKDNYPAPGSTSEQTGLLSQIQAGIQLQDKDQPHRKVAKLQRVTNSPGPQRIASDPGPDPWDHVRKRLNALKTAQNPDRDEPLDGEDDEFEEKTQFGRMRNKRKMNR